jgi:hypothetical protein
MVVWCTKPCARKQRVCSRLQSYDSWKKHLQIDERKQPAIKNGRAKSHKEVCQTRILKLEDENDERSAGQQTRDDTSKVWIFLVEEKQNPSSSKLKNKFCCSFFDFRLQTVCIWRLVLGCVKLSPLLIFKKVLSCNLLIDGRRTSNPSVSAYLLLLHALAVAWILWRAFLCMF